MPTAAARRAAEADRVRQENDSTAEKNAVKRTTEAKKEEPITIDGPFPYDSIIAAAINQEHKFSTVEAEGHSRVKSVIVEKIYHRGIWYHRVKTTGYVFFQSRNAAIENAKKRGIEITEYDNGEI